MLNGKVGIVTGGSRGLGLQLVESLLAQGARVAALARPSADLDALAARENANLAAIPCDIRDSAQVDAAVAAVIQRFGRLDFLINNAAIFHPFKLEDSTPEQVQLHVGINLLGPIWCIRAAIPHLRATRGQILSISSESVRMPFPYLSLYAATKGGLEVLSAALREELREDGIRVTLLRSGSISGSTGNKDWDPAVAEKFFATIVRTGHAAFTGDFATPESMAKAVISVLNLPSDVNVDFLEVRAAKAAGPDSLAKVIPPATSPPA
jgi:NAD(P)-dependent dehydrogenase (short-subunit alcohol dehydrogenase family)